jgi:hypothetical protein
MAETVFNPSRAVSLPWAFVFALVTAAASFGGAYVSTQGAINANREANEQQSQAIISLATRVQNIESDEKVNEVTRLQIQKDIAGTSASLEALQSDVRTRLETVQTTLIQLQVTLGAIKEASAIQLPGDAKKR